MLVPPDKSYLDRLFTVGITGIHGAEHIKGRDFSSLIKKAKALTLVLSWFEQKAVAILLTLLYLNIKGIYIGPMPPAFLSKNVFSILAQKYGLKLISEPEVDLKIMLGS